MKTKRKKNSYARALQYLLIIAGIPLIMGPFFYNWLWHGQTTFNTLKCHVMKISCLYLPKPPLELRLVATLAEAASVVLLLLVCIYFIMLLNLYNKGEYFSQNTLRYYKNITWIAFMWTIYNPIKHMIFSIVTTINNPPGYRILSVTLQGEDLLHIFVVGALLVLNSLMHEAYKLKQEQELTI